MELVEVTGVVSTHKFLINWDSRENKTTKTKRKMHFVDRNKSKRRIWELNELRVNGVMG